MLIRKLRPDFMKMKLNRTIELLHFSSSRMVEMLSEPRGRLWWALMRREVIIHLKRTIETCLLVVRRRG